MGEGSKTPSHSNTHPWPPSSPLHTYSHHTKAMANIIMRRSIHAFLHSYHTFTSVAALLVFPVSASVLLSQALIPSSTPFLKTISSRLLSLFRVAGFPPLQFFSLLNLKLSQTIFSFILTLPFTLTFLLFAKASFIQSICKSPRRGVLGIYSSLLRTHLFSYFLILSANAAVFSFLFLVFNTVDVLGLASRESLLALSAAGFILYSIVIANAAVICNLATIVSAVENCGGYLPVLKACVLIRGRVGTALTLALPANLGMAAVEALFRYRIVKPYHLSTRFNSSMVWEAFSITYMHSILIALDVIVNCMFFKSCKSGCCPAWKHGGDFRTHELEPEEKGALRV